MEVTEANPKLATTKPKMVPNLHAGIATSMHTGKKTVVNASEKTHPAKVSMDRPIGQSKDNLQFVKERRIMKPKVQLEKCILEIWKVIFAVFNEGHS